MNRIKKHYHNNWKKTLLGLEPKEDGLARIKIDEIEVIGISQIFLWMFGLINRSTKDALTFSVMDIRRKEKLLPLIKKMFILIILYKIISILGQGYIVIVIL